MKYIAFFDNNRLVGWQAGGDFELDPSKFDGLFDNFGNPLYELVDGEVVYNPKQPTPEQLRTKYEQIVKQEIAKRYTIDDEIKLLYRGTDLEKKDHEDYIALCKEVATKEVYKEASSDTTNDN